MAAHLKGKLMARRTTLTRSAAALLAAVTLTSCGGGAGPSVDQAAESASAVASSSAAAPELLTLDQVAEVACQGRRPRHLPAGELEMLTSDGATCGPAEMWLFEGPEARDSWADIAKGFAPVVVGTNWAVTGPKRAQLDTIARELDGRVVGGF